MRTCAFPNCCCPLSLLPCRSPRRTPLIPSDGTSTAKLPPSASITARFRLSTAVRSACSDTPRREASLTSTLFFGLRLARDTQFYFDPEIAGGRGFSDTNGIANFPNGEMPRVATATPKPYIARLYVTQDFGFGDEREAIESDENQLAGTRPMTRYSHHRWAASPSPISSTTTATRTIREPSSWAGPSCTTARGIIPPTRAATPGAGCTSSTRGAGPCAMPARPCPKSPTDCASTARLFRDRCDMFEGEVRVQAARTTTAPSACLCYVNHADAGNYADAHPAGRRDRRACRTSPPPAASGLRNTGSASTLEQELTKDVGVFGRLGWNDGKTESFAFTAIDRLATGGRLR